MQLADVFPSPYMHIGGDEVLLECWGEDADLVAWVSEHNTTLPELFEVFEEQIFTIVRNLGKYIYSNYLYWLLSFFLLTVYLLILFVCAGKIPISWQGLIDMKALPKTPTRERNGSSTVLSSLSIVAPWKCWGGLAGHAASVGKADDHPIITSACWYLDFDSEWNDYLRVNPVATARDAPVPSLPPTGAPTAADEGRGQPPGLAYPPSSEPPLLLSDTRVSSNKQIITYAHIYKCL